MPVLAPSSLSPENWFFDVKFLPEPAYMVGGAVRDAILGRTREYLDLDFVLPSDAVQVAREIAKYYRAGFVLLDPQRQIARVVFPNGTADFAQQEGDTIEADLHRRDFTINAIAYNPHTHEIIDPLQGYADLENKLLRMVSPGNLKDDPLRLLRGYRQASQLNFTIETATHSTIQTLAPYISQVAAERVRVELGYMLGLRGTPWLTQAVVDHLLAPFLPSTPAQIELLAIDNTATQLSQTWPQLGVELAARVRDTVKTTWLGITKLATLVHPKPDTAEIELQKLTYSRAEIKAVTTTLKMLPRLNNPQMSLREQYFCFQDGGNVFPATVVLSVARGNVVEAIAPLIRRYLNPDDLVAHPTQIVSGKELIVALNIPSSPLVGKLLIEITVAQIEGRISTPGEAIALARQLIEPGTSFINS